MVERSVSVNRGIAPEDWGLLGGVVTTTLKGSPATDAAFGVPVCLLIRDD